MGNPICLIGEAPGREEVAAGKPFVGPSGKLLDTLLHRAGIVRAECYVDNVFDTQLPGNDIMALCAATRERNKWPDYLLPPLARGKWLMPQYAAALERFQESVRAAQPRVIVALGNTAMWALTGFYGVQARRGYVHECYFLPGVPVIPTYHPAAVLRQYTLWYAVVKDLAKACRPSLFDTTAREIWLEPTLLDIDLFIKQYLVNAPYISLDIETVPKYKQITSFAAGTASAAIVIPFVDDRRADRCYWHSPQGETEALRRVRDICQMPQPKLGQNFTYDATWLHYYGIEVRNYSEDTRLMHHALFPELPKSLAFLGSLYANERAWKVMRTEKETKRDA